MDCKFLLVIDEDEAVFNLFESLLNGDYRILKVFQLNRAIDLVNKVDIDLVFVSNCLSDTDGVEALRTLKRKAPFIPIVFIADSPSQDLIISAFRSGASDFLKKPINKVTLFNCLNRVSSSLKKGQSGDTNNVFDLDSNLSFTKNNSTFAEQSNSKLSQNGGLTDFIDSGSERLPRNGIFTSRFFSKIGINQLNSVIKRTFFKKQNGIKNELVEAAVHNPAIAESESLLSIPEEKTSFEKEADQASIGLTDELVMPTLQIYCLGDFQVIFNGRQIQDGINRKGRAILTFLALNPKNEIHRDILMDKLWPDSPPESARNCLNVALHNVRKQFSKVDPKVECIIFRDERYFINPDFDVWLDVQEFSQNWQRGKRLERASPSGDTIDYYEAAAKLYKEDFMAGDLYETWPVEERENLREIYLFILDRLSQHHMREGEFETAINLCKKILAKDCCHEDIHQRIMRCYYQLGKRDLAIKQFLKCSEALQDELEVEPSRSTLTLYDEIKQEKIDFFEKR